MTKRILALALLTALLLTGCQRAPDTGDTYNPATDWPNFTMASTGFYIAESELGYYVSTGNFLHFVDKQTLASTILCAKPNCLHNQESDVEKLVECNAFFTKTGFNIPVFYMEGAVYVLEWYDPYIFGSIIGEKPPTEYRLLRLSEDGTQRTQVFAISVEFGDSLFFCCHRGMFYYSVEGIISTDDGMEGGVNVYARPIDQINAEPELLFQLTDTHSVSHNFATSLSVYGTRLYIQEYIGETATILHIYDLTTKELTTMPLPEGSEGIQDVVICQDKLYIQYYTKLNEERTSYDPSAPATFYRAELDGSDPQRLDNPVTSGITYSDGTYLYHVTYSNDTEWKSEKLYILDGDMEAVCSYDLAQLSTDGSNPEVRLWRMSDGSVLMKAEQGDEDVYYRFTHEQIQSGSLQLQEILRLTRRAYWRR